MSIMEKEAKPIRYGSLITLSTLESYYLCAQGFIDNSPYLQRSISKNFSDVIFRIIPQSISSVQKELLEFASEIKENELNEKLEKLTKLEDSFEGEISANMQSYSALKGKCVKYDSLVVLEHLPSRKFLTLDLQSGTEIEKENLKVSLEDFPSELSQFRITGGYNFQKYSDGVVRDQDKVHLEISIPQIRKTAFLHGSRNYSNEILLNGIFSALVQEESLSNFLEVNISLDLKTKWVISEFSESIEEDSYLSFGDFIWIIKPEEAFSLSVNKKTQDKNLVFDSNLADTNGLWMIENSDPTKGGLLKFTDECRLRHISTGFYLVIDNHFMITLSENAGFGSLWSFVPLEPDGNRLRVDEICLLINTDTQKTISFAPLNFQVVSVPYVLKQDSIDEDTVYRITRAGVEIVWETQFLMKCYPILTSFNKFINQQVVYIGTDAYRSIYEFNKQAQLIETCLSKLIKFCNNKLQGNIGIDNHYGEVQQNRQKIIKDLDFFEILVNMLDVALSEPIGYQQINEILSERSNSPNKNIKRVDLEVVRLTQVVKIVRKVYVLLTTLCHKNHENEVYAYQFFHVFIKHVGTNLGATDFMLSVLKNNEQIMLSINNPTSIGKEIDVIEEFLSKLTINNKNTPKVIDFLKAVCVFKGQGVTANQKKIFEGLKGIESELIKTNVEKNELILYIERDRYPVEICFEDGRIVGFRDNIEYFTKLLELYANMSAGRNFEVSEEFSIKFPFEAIHSLIWNSKLTDEIRAAFCKLLLNMYVDCSQREEIKKPQLIKDFKDNEKDYDDDHRLDTMSIEENKGGNSIKISDEAGNYLILSQNSERILENFSFSIEDSPLYKLMEKIFDYFGIMRSTETELTFEILRLTSKLIKFELFGTSYTDFDNEEINRNPIYKKHELDIVRILRLILPLLCKIEKRSTYHSFSSKSRKTTVLENTSEKYEKEFVNLHSLLQDPRNLKNPVIRSAANLKNLINSFKQNPFYGIEKKSLGSRIKLKITKMLHHYLNLRQEFLLNNIVEWFNKFGCKSDIEEKDLSQLLPPVMRFAEKQEKFKEFTSGIFGTSFSCQKGTFVPDLNELTTTPLVSILLNLFINSENYKLQSEVLLLIIRMFEQRKELLVNISMLYPVSNSVDIELLIWLRANVKAFKNYSDRSELWITYWKHPKVVRKDYLENLQSITNILNNLEAVLYQDTYIEDRVLRVHKSTISNSRQKMMSYLDVDTLVISLIKDGIHELISIYNTHELKKHKIRLENLFKLCFSFLENFVFSNQKNQKKIYKNLHLFLQHLNINLGQIPLICEIFRNNQQLIEKIDENFLKIFENLINKYGRRAMFLEILQVVQVISNDKPIQIIQRFILNMFVKGNLDHFLLYMNKNDPPEFIFDAVSNDNEDYFDEPYTYHAVLLDVLAKCGYGVTGMYFNEAKCQNIVRLSMIFKILFSAEDSQSPFCKLKIPTLDFFLNIYLDCEINNLELKTCEKFFEYIYFQAEKLNSMEIITQDYLDFLLIFTKILLKYRNFYIKKSDSFYYDHDDSKAIKEFIDSLRNNSHKFDSKSLSSFFISISKDLCDSFGVSSVFTEEPEVNFEEERLKKSLTTRKTADSNKVVGNWNNIRDKLIYNKHFKEKLEAEQRALLVSIHKSELLDPELSSEKILKTLMYFIRLSRSQQPPVSLMLSAIDLLTAILANPIHDQYTKPQDAKNKLQNTISGYGVVRVVLGLMCDKNVDILIYKALINVLIELLDGGNSTVQNEIFMYFNSTAKSQNFFERIHEIFFEYIENFTVVNVKRTKIYKKQHDNIKVLLRLLQLFCENHNLELQNYIRNQNKSLNSYNMISDTISLLEILIEKRLFMSFPIISQCLDSLTEFVQGPCKNNQKNIIDGKFLELAGIILALDEKKNGEVYDIVRKHKYVDTESENTSEYKEEPTYLHGWMISHLKYKCMITILSLLEGRTDNYVVSRMIHAFNIEILKENLANIYINYSEYYTPTHYDNNIFEHIKGNENYNFGDLENLQDQDPKYYVLVIETGFMIYHLLKIFMDSDAPDSQEIIYSELELLQKFEEKEEFSIFAKENQYTQRELNASDIMDAINKYKYDFKTLEEFEKNRRILLNATLKFFDKYTAKIEIVFDGEIFRIYFPLPAEFRGLTPEIIENFHRKVKRDTDQSKLKYLLRKAKSIILQIRHEHFLLKAMQNNSIVSLFASKVYIWRDIAFGLTILLNLVVLLSYSEYNRLDRMNDPALLNYYFEAKHFSVKDTFVIIQLLGIIQLVCCLIIVAFFLLKVGPIVARRGWKRHKPTTRFLRSKPNILRRACLKITQIIWTFFYVICDFHVLYHIAYTIFSVLGIFKHPFYFSLLLLDILYKYPNLQNVVKSFIVPRKPLFLTFCMMIVIMYLFAILGYMYFQDDFNGDCKTLFWCTITLWDGSFKSNGMIGGFLTAYTDGAFHTARFFYDNVFDILLEVIIIGIVEGLIVDTFAVLREKQERSNNDRETICFICGLERDFIERKTNLPFSHHRLTDHNEWNYIFFIAYLLRKEETEYTGLESYVKEQFDKKEINWIPNHKAMAIKNIMVSKKNETLRIIKTIEDRIDLIARDVSELKRVNN